VDGALLYALGSDGDLVCLETATGKTRWRKSLRNDFGGVPGTWAYSESPLIDGDVVACTPGGTEATIVALNKRTGALIWKSAVPGGGMAGYASLVVEMRVASNRTCIHRKWHGGRGYQNRRVSLEL
jgi:outer membrane protein assembly factor BamB